MHCPHAHWIFLFFILNGFSTDYFFIIIIMHGKYKGTNPEITAKGYEIRTEKRGKKVKNREKEQQIEYKRWKTVIMHIVHWCGRVVNEWINDSRAYNICFIIASAFFSHKKNNLLWHKITSHNENGTKSALYLDGRQVKMNSILNQHRHYNGSHFNENENGEHYLII